MEKELELEEVKKDKEKIFWLGVRYYDGISPYVSVWDRKEDAEKTNDVIYKINIPYKVKVL